MTRTVPGRTDLPAETPEPLQRFGTGRRVPSAFDATFVEADRPFEPAAKATAPPAVAMGPVSTQSQLLAKIGRLLEERVP